MVAAIMSFIVLACNGPHAAEFSSNNFMKPVLLAFVAAVFVTLAWIIYKQLRERISLLLAIFSSIPFAIHPLWTIGEGGDCGISKLAGSKFFTSSIGVIFALQLCWWLWQRKLKVER